jgi:uncharacterized membrane protein YciS (DUF1049 family)
MTDFADLQKWNYIACIVHVIAFLLVAINLKSENSKAIIYKYAFDDTVNNISRIDIPVKLEQAGKANLKYILAAFFAVTAISHLLYATDFGGRGYYSKEIFGRGWNPFRWIEYSISASLMIYIICVASGTKEQVTAISTALITPSLMFQGFTVEGLLHQNELQDWSEGKFKMKPEVESLLLWSNFIPAWFLYFIHWYIILSNFSKITKEAKDEGKPVDSSVVFMVWSQLVFFGMFGLIQTYQVYRWTTAKKGRLEWGYIEYEKIYIALSAITKLALAGTVAYALR